MMVKMASQGPGVGIEDRRTMQALFSLVGLLVVVAIVGLIAKKQLQAVAPATPSSASGAPAGGAAPPTVQEQSRGVQQKMLQEINQSLQQGAERAAEPKP